ncbi:MAG: O-methyltransferase [Elusimicrobiales bacterium]
MTQEVRPTPSFSKFDYRVRPNKSTERKMLVDAFRRLSGFAPVEKYRYIGLGSTTFADFILFHKALNISDMISIEHRTEYEPRFEFNRPFECIDIKYGDSNKILPELKWDKKTITWLDYDGALTDAVLQDVAFLSAKCVSGSLMVITVNASGYHQHPGQKYTKAEQGFKDKLGKQLAREVPSWATGINLQGDEMAKTYKRIIYDEVAARLRDRNGMAAPEEVIEFEPLINLVYRDGARMLTVGGIFFKHSEKDSFSKCQFAALDFIGKELYEIQVPVITPRERHYLNQHLPKGALDKITEAIGLTKEEIYNYARSYRYSPSYAEIELS